MVRLECDDDDLFYRLVEQSATDAEAVGLKKLEHGGYEWAAGRSPCRWRPSIHMPRWASRITLEITSIRVERLQDIGEADAIAEGIEREFAHNRDIGWKNYLWHGHFGKNGTGDRRSDNWEHQYSTYADGKAVGSYSSLWEFINGYGSWAENPWVWVIEFTRVTE